VELRLDDQTPWAKLGKRWHLLAKGFGPGKRPKWEMTVLETLFELLEKIEPAGQFTWNNKQVVHFFVPQQKGPWISVQTKKPDAIWLHLSGPANGMALGAVADDFPGCTLGRAGEDVETIRFPLKTLTQVRGRKLRALLEQHLAGLPVG
jgi:excinuclease ABC subunit A